MKSVREELKPMLEIVKELHEKWVVSSYLAFPNNIVIHFNTEVSHRLGFNPLSMNIAFQEGRDNNHIEYNYKRLSSLLNKANEGIDYMLYIG